MDFETAKIIRAGLEVKIEIASAKLNSYPRNEIGLVSDAIKFSPEYRAARAEYSTAAANLKAFNKKFVKHFKTELKAERDKKYSR